MTDLTDPDAITASVRHWVESAAFAHHLEMTAIPGPRFAVTAATTEAELLANLQHELELLDTDPAIETTLLIHPRVLQDFADYNQFFLLARFGTNL